MKDIFWGRIKASNKDLSADFKRIIIIGCFILISFVASRPTAKNGYIEVIANDPSFSENDEVLTDQFGHFQGKWNLWEYIGDFISSMFYTE